MIIIGVDFHPEFQQIASRLAKDLPAIAAEVIRRK